MEYRDVGLAFIARGPNDLETVCRAHVVQRSRVRVSIFTIDDLNQSWQFSHQF